MIYDKQVHRNNELLHEYAGFVAENRLHGKSCGEPATAQFGATQGFYRYVESAIHPSQPTLLLLNI